MSLDEKRIQRLTGTLWEDFEISYGKALRIKIRRACDQERETLGKEELLRNLFLLRRIRDPGFGRHVVHCLKEKRDVLVKTMEYVASTYTAMDRTDSDAMFFPDPTQTTKRQQPFVIVPAKPVLPFEGVDAMLEGFTEHRQHTIEYLKQRAAMAIEAEDDDELASVKWLATDMATDLFRGELLFDAAQLYERRDLNRAWHLELSRFMTLNIRFSQLYFSRWSLAVTLANMLILEKEDIADFFIQGLKELDRGLDLSSEDELLRWSKCLNDAESIAAVTWFSTMPFEERVAMLNAFHDFTIRKEEVSSYLADYPDRAIMTIAQNLHLNQFYPEAAELHIFCLGRSESKETLHVCADGAATEYRKLLEYEKALGMYERDIQITGEGGWPDSVYSCAIAHKNVGEMSIMTGNRQQGKQHFAEALAIASSLPSSKRAAVLWNLACAYRRTGDFDLEFSYLTQALDLGLEDQGKAKNAAVERLMVLNNPDFLRSNGKSDGAKLSEMNLEQDLASLRETASSALSMFQFRRAKDWFAKCDQLQKIPSPGADQAVALYLEGRLQESLETFNSSLDEESMGVSGDAYRGLVEIAMGNDSKGQAILQRTAVQCFALPTDDGYLSNLWDQVLRELLRMKGEEPARGIMEGVAGAIDDAVNRARFINLLAERFSALGFLETSLACCDCIANLNLSVRSNAMALFRRGCILSLWGRLDKATQALSESLSMWDFDGTRMALAETLAQALRFHEASEQVDTLLSRHPENPQLKQMKTSYWDFAKTMINFGSIQDPEVEPMLRSAEALVLKSLKELDELGTIDYSLTLVGYGKAVETMLHKRVGEAARDHVRSVHSVEVIGKHLQATKRPEALPPPLKSLLGKGERSMSLGGWANIDKYASEYSGNPVLETFLEGVRAQLRSKSLAVISRACLTISKLRNPSAHGGVMSRSEVQSVRKEVVTSVNDIIHEVYSKATD